MSRITRRSILPVNQVVPLTYRDGVSLLEMIEELSRYIKSQLHPSLQSVVDNVAAEAEKLLDESHDRFVEGVEEFQRIHDRFMSDVNASLIALNDTAVTDLLDDETSIFGQALRNVFSQRVSSTRVNIVRQAQQLDGAGLQTVIDAHPYPAEFYFSSELANTIDLNGAPLTPSADGQTFIHDSGVTLEQSHLYVPVYDVLDRDNTTIHNLTAVGPDTRPTSGEAFRGSSTANYQAAVWSNSNNTQVTGVTTVKNFKIGVNLAAWDSRREEWVTASKHGNQVENLVVEGADFGVLLYGQNAPVIGHVHNSNNVDSSNRTDPNHAIYVSGNPDVRSKNVTVETVVCENLHFGQPVSVKHTDGLTINSIVSEHSDGVLNFQDVHDFHVTNVFMKSTQKESSTNSRSLALQSPASTNGNFGYVWLNDSSAVSGTGDIVSVLADNISFDNLTVHSHNTLPNRVDTWLTGNNISVGRLSSVAQGHPSRVLRIGRESYPSDGVTIITHETFNAESFLEIEPTVTVSNVVYPYGLEKHFNNTLPADASFFDGVKYSDGVTFAGYSTSQDYFHTSSNYTVKPTDNIVIAQGASLVYLPVHNRVDEGFLVTIKNRGNSEMSVNTPDGADIDSDVSYLMDSGESVRFLKISSRWVIL